MLLLVKPYEAALAVGLGAAATGRLGTSVTRASASESKTAGRAELVKPEGGTDNLRGLLAGLVNFVMIFPLRLSTEERDTVFGDN